VEVHTGARRQSRIYQALIRDNKSLAYSLKDEIGLDPERILCVFYARALENQQGNSIIADFEKEENVEVMQIADTEETYAIILNKDDSDEKEKVSRKMACLGLFDKLKEGSKSVRIFHATGINGIEGGGRRIPPDQRDMDIRGECLPI
jgi:hypothetical protein